MVHNFRLRDHHGHREVQLPYSTSFGGVISKTVYFYLHMSIIRDYVVSHNFSLLLKIDFFQISQTFANFLGIPLDGIFNSASNKLCFRNASGSIEYEKAVSNI